jgi:hypothetical protein
MFDVGFGTGVVNAYKWNTTLKLFIVALYLKQAGKLSSFTMKIS